MSDQSRAGERLAELEARLAFLEETQGVGRVGSFRAVYGPESIVELSEESRRILGVERGSLFRNLDLFLLLHPDDRLRFVDTVAEVRRDGVRRDAEVRIVRSDGSERMLVIVAGVVPGAPLEHAALQGTITDVTDRHAHHVDAELKERLSAEEDLRRAIAEGELFLEFQPVVSLADGHFLGVEALVRWRHPERGRVEPVDFVALAEETGLIHRLGEWVLRQACQERGRWRLAGVGEELVMAVNLSAVQLRSASLPDAVKEALEEGGIDASQLLLEVTESVLVGGTLDEQLLRSIRDLGVHVAIDDFGTQFSSLGYLPRLPVDGLKIDAVFTQGIDDGPGRAVVVAIAALGQALGLSVTAEGIETEQQLAAVREAGCTAGQGFLISAPLGADDCLELLTPDVGREPRPVSAAWR